MNMDFRRWTEDEIEAFRSNAGGFTKDALAALGVRWPPTKGWRTRLRRGEDPNNEAESAATFARLDDGWGIKVPCASREIVPGILVTVVRKDGTTAKVHVGEILRRGSNFTVTTFF
jgi:hypothetical protein